MLKKIEKYFQKDKFMDWEEYEKRVNFLDHFYWQQSIRKRNVGKIH